MSRADVPGGLAVATETGVPIRAVIDTDVGFLNDDSLALLLALASDELDVLGVTVVAGNFDRDQEVVNALSLLEMVGRPDIGVYPGADRPLVHSRQGYEDGVWGEWATFAEPTLPLGRPPAAAAHPGHAVDFIIEMARARPHELTIFCLGPLTNIALALRMAPDVVGLVRRLVIMGGAVASLPGGAGNLTPTAEFNFWVDPEAAQIVLSSGIPALVVPLNVVRRLRYSPDIHQQIVAAGGPVAELLDEKMRPFFSGRKDPDGGNFARYALCDPITVAAGFRPDLFSMLPAFMEVDLSHGMAYGTSYTYVVGDTDQAVVDLDLAAFDGLVQPQPLRGGQYAGRVMVAADLNVRAVAELCAQRLGWKARP